MGSLILCHKKKAKQPYEIIRIHRKIYTIEELCYYLCSHLYLIDYTIVNKELCDWISEELELTELAKTLRASVKKHDSAEHFILTILKASGIYTTGEMLHIQNVLEKLKNQNGTERQKFKADSLLENGELSEAIVVYQSILNGERDESVDGKFYGKIYASLGTAYGRMFLYEEAAKMYESGFQICEEEPMLVAYLYCCRRYMNEEEYKLLLSRSEIYRSIDVLLQQKIEETEQKTVDAASTGKIEQYKKEYRKM